MTLQAQALLRRRTVLAAGVAAATTGGSFAQTGKGRVVKILVGFPAGQPE